MHFSCHCKHTPDTQPPNPPPKSTCRSATALFSSSAVIFRLSQEQIDRLWDDYDKDGNGSLDKDEAHAFFRDVLYRMKVIFEF